MLKRVEMVIKMGLEKSKEVMAKRIGMVFTSNRDREQFLTLDLSPVEGQNFPVLTGKFVPKYER